jgi:hypothetical protein
MAGNYFSTFFVKRINYFMAKEKASYQEQQKFSTQFSLFIATLFTGSDIECCLVCRI